MVSASIAESVGVSLVDEIDFQKEGKRYILSKNSQFEVCSTVSLDIKGSLAGISDFGEDIVSEAGNNLSGISSHDDSNSGTDSDYNTEPSIISTISSCIPQPKRVIAILYSRGSNFKAYNYHKLLLWTIFE